MKYKKLNVLGTSILYFCLIILFVTFMFAYSVPQKEVNVNVNSFGEAKGELFLVFPVLFFLGTLSLVSQWKEYYRKEEK